MDIVETLFGPLSNTNCYYFYLIMVFDFILMIVLGFVGMTVRHKRWPQTLTMALNCGLLYYVARIQYSMCMKSLT
jgi:hypothetical protein